ncbi:hypothetical protein CF326_g1960 [Tilletia indica]|nr:hypothetical protein CF326_g1960 [Tilletia indica]
MGHDTLWLSIHIFHRYLNESEDTVYDYSVSALTSLYIASKYEETTHPTLNCLKHRIDGLDTTREQMRHQERSILRTLGYSFSNYVSPSLWIYRIWTTASHSPEVCRIATVLAESTITYNAFVAVPSRRLAAAAMFLALTMSRIDWDPTHESVSGYRAVDLVPTAKHLLAAIRSPSFPTSFTFHKYAHTRHQNIGVHIRAWAFHNDL